MAGIKLNKIMLPSKRTYSRSQEIGPGFTVAASNPSEKIVRWLCEANELRSNSPKLKRDINEYPDCTSNISLKTSFTAFTLQIPTHREHIPAPREQYVC